MTDYIIVLVYGIGIVFGLFAIWKSERCVERDQHSPFSDCVEVR